jgi:hypothetical protein
MSAKRVRFTKSPLQQLLSPELADRAHKEYTVIRSKLEDMLKLYDLKSSLRAVLLGITAIKYPITIIYWPR